MPGDDRTAGAKAAASGITLFRGSSFPLYVKADRTRVKQVLINLLINAIKYNNLKDRHRGLRCRPPGASHRGHGHRRGLTRTSSRSCSSRSTALGQEANGEEGTGIGLVVCKRLVELMGGVIGVESNVGKGSVFWIELKETAAPQLAGGTSRSLSERVQIPARLEKDRWTVLYVEDNPANLMLVEDLIARRPDIRLLSARDGDRGIEIARAARPDMVLMDINLPGMSGITALRILANDPGTAHIPVVALSANAIPRDIEKGLQAGFFRYLTKPINVVEFMETLDVTLKFAKANAIVATTGSPNDL
jgi:CheY-like chemotaxis protein